MSQIGEIGGVGGQKAAAPAANMQQAPAATQGAARTDEKAATPGGGTTDAVKFSDELEEEGGVHGAQTDNKKADGVKETEDPKNADEAKRKEDEKKLKALEREIKDTQDQLEEAQKKGDQNEVDRLKARLGDLTTQRDDLVKQMQPPAQHGGNAGGAAPVGGPEPAGGGSQAGGGGGAPMAGGGDWGGRAGGGNAGGGGGTNIAPANGANPSPPISLKGDDKKTADFINKYLGEKGSPAAGKGAGEMMVKYGKENKVDPLLLLSIAGQETQFGKTGIGVNGMLGVGAYDSDPNNATRNPTFSGVENQIKRGAETFARLRAKGGSNEGASIAQQAAAVNKAGWATDPNWHNGVTRMYAQVSQAAGG